MLLLKSVLDNKGPHTSTTKQRVKFVPTPDIRPRSSALSITTPTRETTAVSNWRTSTLVNLLGDSAVLPRSTRQLPSLLVFDCRHCYFFDGCFQRYVNHAVPHDPKNMRFSKDCVC